MLKLFTEVVSMLLSLKHLPAESFRDRDLTYDLNHKAVLVPGEKPTQSFNFLSVLSWNKRLLESERCFAFVPLRFDRGVWVWGMSDEELWADLLQPVPCYSERRVKPQGSTLHLHNIALCDSSPQSGRSFRSWDLAVEVKVWASLSRKWRRQHLLRLKRCCRADLATTWILFRSSVWYLSSYTIFYR